MKFQNVGMSLAGAVAVIAIMLAGATVWLFLTNPVTVATATSMAEIRNASAA